MRIVATNSSKTSKKQHRNYLCLNYLYELNECYDVVFSKGNRGDGDEEFKRCVMHVEYTIKKVINR